MAAEVIIPENCFCVQIFLKSNYFADVQPFPHWRLPLVNVSCFGIGPSVSAQSDAVSQHRTNRSRLARSWRNNQSIIRHRLIDRPKPFLPEVPVQVLPRESLMEKRLLQWQTGYQRPCKTGIFSWELKKSMHSQQNIENRRPLMSANHSDQSAVLRGVSNLARQSTLNRRTELS